MELPPDMPDWMRDPKDKLRVRNHWVPTVYLRNFTDTGKNTGRFWMYDREDSSQPREVRPTAVARKKYLYVMDEDVGIEPRDLVERVLAYAEQPFPSIYTKLVHGPAHGLYRRLMPEEWLQLRTFLAMQYMRTPFQRDVLEAMRTFPAHFETRARLEDPEFFQQEYEELTGKRLPVDEIVQMRQELDEDELIIGPHPSMWLGHAMEQALTLSELIAKLPWRIVRAPEGISFPTSDLPVVLVHFVPEQRRYRIAGGWLRDDTEITLTLDPAHVLVLGFRVDADNVGSAEWCSNVAVRTAHHSERFVFAREPTPEIPRILARTEPPKHVVEFGGREYAIDAPVGPIVKRLLEDRASSIIRFGPAAGQLVGGDHTGS